MEQYLSSTALQSMIPVLHLYSPTRIDSKFDMSKYTDFEMFKNPILAVHKGGLDPERLLFISLSDISVADVA